LPSLVLRRGGDPEKALTLLRTISRVSAIIEEYQEARHQRVAEKAMTIDERLETLAMHLEVVTQMHEDFEKRMTQYSADLKDAIKRLANVAAAHD
jgi:hypothetical protein